MRTMWIFSVIVDIQFIIRVGALNYQGFRPSSHYILAHFNIKL